MIRGFLRYAGGSGLGNDGSKAVEVESAGGINAGLSALALVSALAVANDAGVAGSLGASVPWIIGVAVAILYFFVLRIVYSSALSFSNSEEGKVTVSALGKMIPHLVIIMIFTMPLSNIIGVELQKNEINFALSRQMDAYQQKLHEMKPEAAGENAAEQKIALAPLPVGLMRRIEIANQISPTLSAFISMLITAVSVAPLFIKIRRRA